MSVNTGHQTETCLRAFKRCLLRSEICNPSSLTINTILWPRHLHSPVCTRFEKLAGQLCCLVFFCPYQPPFYQVFTNKIQPQDADHHHHAAHQPGHLHGPTTPTSHRLLPEADDRSRRPGPAHTAPSSAAHSAQAPAPPSPSPPAAGHPHHHPQRARRPAGHRVAAGYFLAPADARVSRQPGGAVPAAAAAG